MRPAKRYRACICIMCARKRTSLWAPPVRGTRGVCTPRGREYFIIRVLHAIFMIRWFIAYDPKEFRSKFYRSPPPKRFSAESVSESMKATRPCPLFSVLSPLSAGYDNVNKPTTPRHKTFFSFVIPPHYIPIRFLQKGSKKCTILKLNYLFPSEVTYSLGSFPYKITGTIRLSTALIDGTQSSTFWGIRLCTYLPEVFVQRCCIFRSSVVAWSSCLFLFKKKTKDLYKV